MTANELEKLRLSILDEAEQHKGMAFSIIVLAVLASALWLFFNFRDQLSLIFFCLSMMMLAVGSSVFRANSDKVVSILFIYCLIIFLDRQHSKMQIRYLAFHGRSLSSCAFVILRRGCRAGADQI